MCLDDKSSNAFRKLRPGNIILKIYGAFIPHCKVPAGYVLSYACCFPPIVCALGFAQGLQGEKKKKS